MMWFLKYLLTLSSSVFKCVRNDLDFLSQYRHHIKTAGRRLSIAVSVAIVRCRPADNPLLFVIHRLKGTAAPGIPPILDLHKDQIFSVLCYNINLSTAAPEIILHYPVSPLFQIISRLLLISRSDCPFIQSIPCTFRFFQILPGFRLFLVPSGFQTPLWAFLYNSPESLSLPFMRSISSTNTKISATTS